MIVRSRLAAFAAALALALSFTALAEAATVGMSVAELGLAREETGSLDFARTLLVASIRSAVSPSPGLGPTVLGGEVIDTATNVLLKIVNFATDRPAIPRVFVEGGGRSWWVPRTGFLTEWPATGHSAIIAGMKADTDYTVTVSGLDDDNLFEGSKASYAIHTGTLPASFPPMRVTVNKPDKRTPGVILFDITRQYAPEDVGRTWFVILDADGDPVWYYNNRFFLVEPNDIRRISNGNFLYIGFDAVDATAARELSLLGAELRSWSLHDLQIHSMHHELGQLPDGNFVALSSFLHFFDDYPPDLFGIPFGAEHWIVSDVIVIFNPAGEIVYFYDLIHSLDHQRVLPGFEETGFWEFTYGPGVNDWGHGNGVVLDERDNTWIVSLRHQDIVFKMTMEGELVWVLGEEHYTSAEDDAWPWLTFLDDGTPPKHQHAPKILPNGNLLVYDNAFALDTRTSRAVEYEIDEENLTVRQVWEWYEPDADPPLFSIALSDADQISPTNYLIDDGALERYHTLPVTLEGAYTRLVEVHRPTNEKVFELIARDSAEEEPESFLSYRAFHMPSIYPPLASLEAAP